ncbi:MAG: CAP domain-containing protein [Anaerolineales bacterium]|nr:CAP domain-containing protein [Anaerolineales bacterium]
MDKKKVFLGLVSIILLVLLARTGQDVKAEESSTNYVVFLPLVSNENQEIPAGPEWLTAVNEFRAQAHLPYVTEEAEWSEGAWLHSRYMVKTDIVEHDEDKSNKWYTPEGKAAAQSSVIVASYDSSLSDEFAIDAWMQAPFHSVSLLDPRLSTVGFGSYREEDGGYQIGATLDVIRGMESMPRSVQYPVQWPADGETVPLFYFWGEYPDPLSSCVGYTSPSGLPIIVQLGDGSKTPSVTAHSISQDGNQLEHCVFDETNYKNQDDSYGQSLGRSILDYRDAVVIIPRYPLTPGASYTVSLTANGHTYTWTFSVSASVRSSQLENLDLSQGQPDLGHPVPN